MTDPSVREWSSIMAAQAHGYEVPTVSSEDPGIDFPKVDYIKAGPLPDHLEFPKAGPEWENSPIPTVGEVEAAVAVAKGRHEDVVGMPSHYTHLPVEAIDITEHFNFCMGNALKYIWRADHKGKPVEDLRKAAWYIQREIERRERT